MSIEKHNFVKFEPATTEAEIQTTADYDSGWQEANNHSNNAVTFAHGLGVIPSQTTIMFSADKQTVYPLTWSWSSDSSGNPVTIWMNDNVVVLEIYKGVALHGAWDNVTGWTKWSQGYFRVLAWK